MTDQPRRRDPRNLALTALIVALLGLISCGTGSVVGIVLGIIARRRIRAQVGAGPGPLPRGDGGESLARAGVIVGWAGVAFYAVVGAALAALIVWAATHPGDGTHYHHHFDFGD
jgi:hypothetical protein